MNSTRKKVTKLETKHQASKPEPVLTKKRKEKKTKRIPCKQRFIVLRISNRIIQATNRQVNKLHYQVG